MSRQRDAGTAFEQATATYLAGHGFPHAERRVTHGKMDRGDIAGVPGITFECKALKGITLAAGMAETYTEQANGEDPFGVLVNKGRNRPIADAYVTMPLWEWTVLARLSGFGKPIDFTPELQRQMAAAASRVRARPLVGWEA